MKLGICCKECNEELLLDVNMDENSYGTDTIEAYQSPYSILTKVCPKCGSDNVYRAQLTFEELPDRMFLHVDNVLFKEDGTLVTVSVNNASGKTVYENITIRLHSELTMSDINEYVNGLELDNGAVPLFDLSKERERQEFVAKEVHYNLEMQDLQSKKKVLTIGKLLTKLMKLDPKMLVKFYLPYDRENGDNLRIVGLESYRGMYTELSFDYEVDDKNTLYWTVEEIMNKLESSVGSMFSGYKGGRYKMKKGSLLYLSQYGVSSHYGITDVIIKDNVCCICTELVE